MKKTIALLLCALMLAGCSSQVVTEVTRPESPVQQKETAESVPSVPIPAPEYTSRFDTVTEIQLLDTEVIVQGGETQQVFTSRDIIYYEDRDSYDSGNPYGEGASWEKHSAEEAAEHTVVNITAPGAYRISGTLSAGQIRVDLGEDASEDPNAVVELILKDADITCTVAPAVLFLNTYECDGSWSAETAKAEVDTTAAGANLILEGTNTVSGSHVAKIFKDKDGEKKLWKQDGAVYSYMSMNVFGPGSLDLTADNEGLDTELHLTVNGGSIRIFSDNDGINTNEDGVSVTTINGGMLMILAGLGEEGDGIDSNGYLVINGGYVVASANPRSDAGLDSDLGSYIHGGHVIALGSTMDWAESESGQVTLNLQFAAQQNSSEGLTVAGQDGTVVFSFMPEWEAEYNRAFSGAILSGPWLTQGEVCTVYLGGSVTGTRDWGFYDPATVTGFEGGSRLQYSGTDVRMGGFGGMRPDGQRPENFDPEKVSGKGRRSQGGMMPPDGERPERPEGETFPEWNKAELPGGGMGGRDQGGQEGQPRSDFFLADMVNCFSGITKE